MIPHFWKQEPNKIPNTPEPILVRGVLRVFGSSRAGKAAKHIAGFYLSRTSNWHDSTTADFGEYPMREVPFPERYTPQ